MKLIRTLHTYLGCGFAPMLALFIFTGFLQTFDLHEGRKNNSYHPWNWVKSAASVHMHQRLPVPNRRTAPKPTVMRIAVATMCAGLLASVTLGVAMAWQVRKNRAGVLAALGAGVLIPAAILLMQ